MHRFRPPEDNPYKFDDDPELCACGQPKATNIYCDICLVGMGPAEANRRFKDAKRFNKSAKPYHKEIFHEENKKAAS